MLDDPIEAVRRGATVSGNSLILDECSDRNWPRFALSVVSFRLYMHVFRRVEGTDNYRRAQEQFNEVLKTLRDQLTNPVHYEDNRPGHFSERNSPLVPDAQFDYLDLVDFGMSGPDGRRGFLKSAQLPSSLSTADIYCAAGLLLIDDAESLLRADQGLRFAYLLHRAGECEANAQDERSNEERSNKRRSLTERAQAAGRASGATRQRNARAKPAEVIAAADELRNAGVNARGIAAKLAQQFNVVPRRIRDILNGK
jgi:hypothetical protein